VARVKPKGVSVLSIAASLPAVGGRVSGARIAYGAMAPTAIRAKAAERSLEGRTLDESGVTAAVAAAAEGTSPATDAIASAWYRREVVGVHLRRLLLGREA
jgi:xanthine dehydrogenase small subunit